MSTYTSTAFKAYWGSSGGPFAATPGSVTAAKLQQLANDIGDSTLFQDKAVNTDRNYFESDDFVVNTSGTTAPPPGWLGAVSGAGAADAVMHGFGVNSTEKAIGTIGLQTGTTATGYALIYKGVQAIVGGVGHLLRVRMRVGLETLGSGTQRYTAYAGFGDNIVSGDMTNGIYFRYNDNVNSGKWECVTAAAGVRTATDSGVTAVVNYQIFEARLNEAGTSAEFYIDDVLVATNTTNIPTAVLGLIFKIEKSIGTTTRTIHMDWYDFLISTTSAR